MILLTIMSATIFLFGVTCGIWIMFELWNRYKHLEILDFKLEQLYCKAKRIITKPFTDMKGK